jgi:benzil reductase ((S)-benzoin forming)
VTTEAPPTTPFCLVTGTSSGIGLAVADALLRRGWEVLGVARRPSSLHHGRYRHLRLDLSDLAAVEAAFEGRLGDELRLAGRPRVGLVNGAASVEPVGPTSALAAAALARAFAVNAVAPVWLLGFFLRRARETRLRVVDVSSGAAHRPYAGWSAYCATKAALRMAGEVVGAEAAAFAPGSVMTTDVAVVSYEPGVVDTEMQASVRGAIAAAFPHVKRFLDLHARGELHPPSRPAEEIALLLESDGLPAFSERRLGA